MVDDDDSRAEGETHPRNDMATAGLILGALSVIGGITSCAGLACSIIGLARASSRHSGYLSSVIGFVLSLLGIGVFLAFYCETRYISNYKSDDAQQSMKVLEQACKNYALKNDGIPPATLKELIKPPDGGRPWVEGAEAALIDPWGNPFQYNPLNKKPDGTPDPFVFTIDPHTKKAIYALGRGR
jgi:hypothetical protein